MKRRTAFPFLHFETQSQIDSVKCQSTVQAPERFRWLPQGALFYLKGRPNQLCGTFFFSFSPKILSHWLSTADFLNTFKHVRPKHFPHQVLRSHRAQNTTFFNFLIFFNFYSACSLSNYSQRYIENLWWAITWGCPADAGERNISLKMGEIPRQNIFYFDIEKLEPNPSSPFAPLEPWRRGDVVFHSAVKALECVRLFRASLCLCEKCEFCVRSLRASRPAFALVWHRALLFAAQMLDPLHLHSLIIIFFFIQTRLKKNITQVKYSITLRQEKTKNIFFFF